MRVARFIPVRIERIGVIVLMSYLAFAISASIMAIYVYSFLKNDSLVGLVFTLLAVLSIISHFFIIPVIESKSKSRIFFYTLILTGLGYLLYSIIENFYLFFIVAVFITILSTLRITVSGLLIEHSSTKRNLARNEGIIYTIMNLAWAVGPLIVGFILEQIDNLRNIFIISAIILILAGIVFRFLKVSYSGRRKKVDGGVIKNFREFFRDKKRRTAYILGAGASFWWILIFIYMPLLIIQTLRDFWVGFFLFFVMIPMIFFSYYFGNLVERKGYKKIFVIGFLLTSIMALLGFLFFSNIWTVMLFMCLASIGLAMTEGTSEAYFFDILKKKEDQRFYSPYNTAIDVGNLIGEFIPALILFFLPFRFIFLFFALGMFILALISLRIKDVIESRRKAKKFE